MSVCMAASQHAGDPGNSYLLVSQAGVVETLERLAREDPDLAHFRFRDACGYEASPHARAVRQFFESGAAGPAAVLEGDLAAAPVLDLSTAMPPLDRLAIGRYDEQRAICTAPEFHTPDGRRGTRHMAIDLFAPAGTPIFAALDGVVERREHRDRPGDHGGLLVLRHRTGDGLPFWTLHGHLDPQTLAAGAVRAGDEIARLGAPEVNGGWPPHLHLQLFTDLVADLPGMAPPDEADVWRSVCPDPEPAARPRGGRRRAGGASRSRVPAARGHEPRALARLPRAAADRARARRVSSTTLAVAPTSTSSTTSRTSATATRASSRRARRRWRQLNTNTRYLHDTRDRPRAPARRDAPGPAARLLLRELGQRGERPRAAARAATYTGREDVIVLDHAYHGHLSSLIALSPYKFNRRGGRGQVRARPTSPPLPDRRPRPLGTVACATQTPSATAHPEPAAFFAESLQGCGGQVVYPPGYLAAAFAHVRDAGGVCVADEVQVGFGRVGEHFWGFELGGVVPDIVTMGKPMGNGHPLAAVVDDAGGRGVVRDRDGVLQHVRRQPGFRRDRACGARRDRDERLQAHARAIGAQLLNGLRELTGRHAAIADVRGHGLFLGVELAAAGPGGGRRRQGGAQGARRADLDRRAARRRAQDQAAAGDRARRLRPLPASPRRSAHVASSSTST